METGRYSLRLSYAAFSLRFVYDYSMPLIVMVCHRGGHCPTTLAMVTLRATSDNCEPSTWADG
jgi:hypothetical protein